ncbi:hypothetical protein [Natrarchaeobius oligotrophus]|uniref:hypothetical protein n=1 Tax=Natrarchaeobius oligotrophus TaxID=3455743 RepID=UPI0014048002|nr:hypothetical protein [Natrarchaeobius chitinivorans]
MAPSAAAARTADRDPGLAGDGAERVLELAQLFVHLVETLVDRIDPSGPTP